jgi:hypothetical protein
VIGLRLADGRAVLVKVRPGSPRLAACVAFQRRLFESGYPCPEPLTGPIPFGDDIATAEAYVPGGAVHAERGPRGMGVRGGIRTAITLAPRPAEVPGGDFMIRKA